jgi:O-antigen ligase
VLTHEDLRISLGTSMVLSWLLLVALLWVLSPWSAALLVIVGMLVVITHLSLEAAVVLFIVLMPFDIQRQVGGQWVYIDLLFVAIFLPLLRLRRLPPKHCRLLIPFFAYFVLTGATRTLLPAWFWGYVVRWVIGLGFSAAIAMSAPTEALILVSGATLVPLTAYGLYQLFIDDFGRPFAWMNPHMMGQPWSHRSYSFMWHPNAFGDFVGMISVMLMALGVRGHRPKLAYSLAAFGVLGLLCSGSRGAEIAEGVVILVLLTQTPRYWRKLGVIALLVIIVFGALHYDVIPLERAEQLDDFTTQTRLLVWGEAYLAWRQHPWFGVGATNFSSMMGDYGTLETAHAHNTYLQILSETGIIGFALFYAPLGYLLWRAWKHRNSPLALAGGCALIFWLIHGFVDVVMAANPQSLLLFFAVVGLIVSGSGPSKVLSMVGPTPTAA